KKLIKVFDIFLEVFTYNSEFNCNLMKSNKQKK
ncbi:MAG: hypothetical protein ACJAVD_001554, partial [Porticoccaceae bacterium]